MNPFNNNNNNNADSASSASAAAAAVAGAPASFENPWGTLRSVEFKIKLAIESSAKEQSFVQVRPIIYIEEMDDYESIARMYAPNVPLVMQGRLCMPDGSPLDEDIANPDVMFEIDVFNHDSLAKGRLVCKRVHEMLDYADLMFRRRSDVFFDHSLQLFFRGGPVSPMVLLKDLFTSPNAPGDRLYFSYATTPARPSKRLC